MTDKTLARIGGLLRMAESTDNDHEADAFLTAAQRLATAAAVDLAVARSYAQQKEKRAAPIQQDIVIGEAGKRGLRTYIELFLAIARANDITCDIARNSTRVFAYGFDSDIRTAEALYASLVVQMVRASDHFISSKAYTAEKVRRYSATKRRWEVRPVSGITARISFQRAFAQRVALRLQEARSAAVADATVHRHRQDAHRKRRDTDTGGVALALRQKELQLADYYRSHSQARGRWKGSAATAGHSRHASRAGDRAGRRARLGTEAAIGGSRPAVASRKRKV